MGEGGSFEGKRGGERIEALSQSWVIGAVSYICRSPQHRRSLHTVEEEKKKGEAPLFVFYHPFFLSVSITILWLSIFF